MIFFFSSIAHQSDPHCSLSCSFSQIERRISAFIERKQLEINENNVREFCNVIDCNQGENGRALATWGVVRGTAQQLPMFVRVLISSDMRSEYTHRSKTQSSTYNQTLKALYILTSMGCLLLCVCVRFTSLMIRHFIQFFFFKYTFLEKLYKLKVFVSYVVYRRQLCQN